MSHSTPTTAPLVGPAGGADGSGRMFDRIAARYDRVNRVLSLGLDQGWRRKLVAALPPDRGPDDVLDPRVFLDVATGTADVALAIAAARPHSRVVGLDPSGGMLAVGHQKVARGGLTARVSLVEGDAQALPFEDDHFDGTCISFGIRNVPDRRQGLAEMRRVTRPGGPVVVLELGEPREGLLAPFARFHVRQVVPRLGALLSGDAEYRYLQRSVAAFPPAAEFADLMRSVGLVDVKVRRLTFGAAHLYVGTA